MQRSPSLAALAAGPCLRVNPADLNRMGVTHVFVGTRGGAFDVPMMLNAPEVELVFHRDGAYLFQLR